MFPIHERTRRWICRTAFLIAGVLPMMAVAAWSASVHSAAHLAAVRARLADAVGLDVRLERVSYPRPDFVLYHGLQLIDPETGGALASIRMLELGGDDQSQTIVASQPEVNLTDAKRLWALIDRLWVRRSQLSLRVAASELTLRWPVGVQTFARCSAKVDSALEGNTITAAFQSASASSAEPIQL